MFQKLLLVWFAVSVTGCATAYQSGTFSFTGGHYQSSGPGSLEKVAFSGNGFIDSTKVQQFALYRCAEIAKEKNKPYFLIFDSLMAASIPKPSDMPNVGLVGGKPTAFAFMLLLDGPRAGAKETRKVLSELEAVVKPANTAPNT